MLCGDSLGLGDFLTSQHPEPQEMESNLVMVRDPERGRVLPGHTVSQSSSKKLGSLERNRV